MYRNLDYTVINRSVYDVLNFFGDVGGLLEFLIKAGLLTVSSSASFVGLGYFMSSLFYTNRNKEGTFSDRDSDDQDGHNKNGDITKDGLSKGE